MSHKRGRDGEFKLSDIGRDRRHAIDVDACDGTQTDGQVLRPLRLNNAASASSDEIEIVDDSSGSAEEFIPFLDEDADGVDDTENDDDDDGFIPFERDEEARPTKRQKIEELPSDTLPCTASSRLLHMNATIEPLLTACRRYLERKWGVSLRIGDDSVEITSSDAIITDVATAELSQVIEQPPLLESELRDQYQQLIHIFVDESNIFLGAQTILQPDGRRIRDTLIRMNVPALVDVILNQRQPIQRVVFGSRSSAQEPVEWNEWRAAGFDVHGERRHRGGGETFVDDACAAMVNAAILRFPIRNESVRHRTLVLLTGDGNMNDGRASFIESVDSALRNGWRVELWSWRASISQHYLRMRDQYASSGLFSIHFLDEHRATLTVRVATPPPPVTGHPQHRHPSLPGRHGHNHHRHHQHHPPAGKRKTTAMNQRNHRNHPPQHSRHRNKHGQQHQHKRPHGNHHQRLTGATNPRLDSGL